MRAFTQQQTHLWSVRVAKARRSALARTTARRSASSIARRSWLVTKLPATDSRSEHRYSIPAISASAASGAICPPQRDVPVLATAQSTGGGAWHAPVRQSRTAPAGTQTAAPARPHTRPAAWRQRPPGAEQACTPPASGPLPMQTLGEREGGGAPSGGRPTHCLDERVGIEAHGHRQARTPSVAHVLERVDARRRKLPQHAK
jgi:hypothetical protein